MPVCAHLSQHPTSTQFLPIKHRSTNNNEQLPAGAKGTRPSHATIRAVKGAVTPARRLLQTLNVDTPPNSSAALFGMYPREMKRASTQKLAHRVLTVALLTVPQATHTTRMSIRRRLKKQNTLPPHNGRLCRSVLPATPPTSRMPGEEPGTETTRFTVPFIRTAQRGKSTDREQISGGGGWSVSAQVRGSLRVAEMSESNSGRQKQSVPNRVHLEERHLKNRQ